MIPVTVCIWEKPENFISAGAMLFLAILLGGLVALRRDLRVRVAVFAIAMFFPCAALAGLWPFNRIWADCAWTPDPNIMPLLSALTFPVVVAVTWLMIRLATRFIRPAR